MVGVPVGITPGGVIDGVKLGNGVVLGVAVITPTTGVNEAVFTPITMGVAVKIDGGCVKGRKGVGGL